MGQVDTLDALIRGFRNTPVDKNEGNARKLGIFVDETQHVQMTMVVIFLKFSTGRYDDRYVYLYNYTQ